MCQFNILPGTVQAQLATPFLDKQGNPIYLPALNFFTWPFEFIPKSPSCTDLESLEPCTGTFTFPTNGLPVTIKTTSSIANLGNPDLTITLVDSQPLGTSGQELTYRIDAARTIASDITQSTAVLKKSQLSPYLQFYSKQTLISMSTLPRFNSVEITPAQDCYGLATPLCTLMFRVNKYLFQYQELFVRPLSYLTAPTNTIGPCPDGTDTGTDIGQDYVLLCQTWRKPLDSVDERAALQGKISLLLSGPSYSIETSIPADNIAMLSPFWVDWDLDLCRDSTIPVCTASVESVYSGPPIEVGISMPFDSQIDRVECNTNQMSVSPNKLNMPSLTAPVSSGDVIAPTGDVYHQCKVFFTIGYQQQYDFSNTSIKITSFRFGLSPLLRAKFTAELPLPSKTDINFSAFPIVITPYDDCGTASLPFCTVDLSVDPTKVSPENFFRSVTLYLPGADSQYALEKGYTLTNSGFNQATITHNIEILPDSDPTNQLRIDALLFVITIKHTQSGLQTYLNSTIPAVITIQYRKLPNIAIAANETTPGSTPWFYSYAYVSVLTQPPLAQVIPNFPTSYPVIFRAPESPVFSSDCMNPSSLYCTLSLTRWRPDLVKTYFSAYFEDFQGNQLPTQVTALRTDRYLINSQIGAIDDMGDGTPGYLGYIPWNQFTSDDPTQPLPSLIEFAILKTIGSSEVLNIIIYSMTPDFTKVVAQILYSQKVQFLGDAFPVFDGSTCNSYTSPICTADYVINNSIPPNWMVMQHPINTQIVNKISIDSCSNTNSSNPIPFSLVLSRAGSADFSNIIRQEDFISLSNPSATAIYPVDPTAPITCKVSFVLNNIVSPPKHIVKPFAVQNQTQDLPGQTIPLSVILPRMAWSPTSLSPLPNCLTHQPQLSSCTIRADFFGTPDNPIFNLTQTLPPSFIVHPLIHQGTYSLYLAPVLPGEESIKQLVAVAHFTLDQIAGLPTGYRQFTFTITPAYQTRTFSAYFSVSNTVIPGVPILVPSFNLPLNLNGVTADVTANFRIPAILSGPVFEVGFSSTRFQAQGTVFALAQFALNVTEITIETNFGFKDAFPCIESASPTSLANYWPTTPSVSSFQEISSEIGASAQQDMLSTLIQSGAFSNLTISSPRILGWFTPFSQSLQVQGTTTPRVETRTKFTINPDLSATGLAGKSCAFYIPVNHSFPSYFQNIRHLIKISTPSFTDETFYLVQNYPFLSSTATITQKRPVH